jgi:hypothetical protein
VKSPCPEGREDYLLGRRLGDIQKVVLVWWWEASGNRTPVFEVMSSHFTEQMILIYYSSVTVAQILALV